MKRKAILIKTKIGHKDWTGCPICQDCFGFHIWNSGKKSSWYVCNSCGNDIVVKQIKRIEKD